MPQSRHETRQQRLKDKVDARIEAAQIERGIVLVFTGNGKGKTTAAFGTVCRAIGHGKKAAVIQFIKGSWDNGERELLEPHGVPFHVMATGFTWETQNRQTDTLACLETWEKAKQCLSDPRFDLVVLDELTYMISYHYLSIDDVIAALQSRPDNMSVVITGRGCHRDIIELADTVTEMRPIKHAFDIGIKAQKGIDW